MNKNMLDLKNCREEDDKILEKDFIVETEKQIVSQEKKDEIMIISRKKFH